MINKHHLIFEGAELTGKSFLMSQIYDWLEKKHHTHPKILNGCHWFNCDVGVFGLKFGKEVIEQYVDILKILKDQNVLFEKFHLTDMVYHQLYSQQNINYQQVEKQLKKLNTKIVLLIVKDKSVFAARLADRLKIHPHYARILQTPEDYWQQQTLYLELIKKSQLEHLIVDFSGPLTDEFIRSAVNNILHWLGEK